MTESSWDQDFATLWMGRLLRRAAVVGRTGEVPVAAVILDGRGRSIGWGVNQRERGADPLGHGELVALRQAAALRGDWRFNDCTLLVTLEPCIMCAAALVQARMGSVVFGAADRKRGGLGGVLDLSKSAAAHHHMAWRSGVLAEECRVLLQDWFRQRREGAGAAGRSAAPRSQPSCSDP